MFEGIHAHFDFMAQGPVVEFEILRMKMIEVQSIAQIIGTSPLH